MLLPIVPQLGANFACLQFSADFWSFFLKNWQNSEVAGHKIKNGDFSARQTEVNGRVVW